MPAAGIWLQRYLHIGNILALLVIYIIVPSVSSGLADGIVEPAGLGFLSLVILLLIHLVYSMKNPTERCLLIVDGHNSHFSTDFLKHYSQNYIEVFCLLLYTTHMVSYNVVLFDQLQSYYKQYIKGYLHLIKEARTQ